MQFAPAYDTIVLGLGAMGASTAYHLAKHQKKVLGLEQFECAHAKGSSHGATRLIRQAYFEHPDYVPLLRRSYELWDELFKRHGKNYFHKTGVVIYGPENGGKILPGIRLASREHQIPIQEFSAQEASKRFPLLKVPEGYSAILEPGAGFLEVENCVRVHCEEAQKLGATLKFNEEVLGWESTNQSVTVKTTKGSYSASHLVITAGPWSSKILKNFGMSLKVQRVPLYWFEANNEYSESNGFPSFAYDLPYGFIYGFPYKKGEGIKISPHIPGPEVENPTLLDKNSTAEELEPVVKCLREYFPEINPTPIKSAMCMYTMSKDTNFIIDTYPGHPNVHFAAGFSGHGFKFSSVVGEVLTELTLDGKTKSPIDFLRIRK